MVDGYNETQVHILAALYRSGGREVSGRVKDMVQESKLSSISRSGVDKQIQTLRESGEIEVVGKTDTAEHRMGSNVYGLSENGRDVAEECADAVSFQTSDSAQELAGRINELEKTVDEIHSLVKAHGVQLEQNEKRFQAFNKRTKELRDKLE